MPQHYTKEQFWKLYEKLPQELKDALFAEETGNTIHETCTRNNVGSHLEEVVELTGQVLVGLLLPQDFPKALEGLNIKKDVAQKIAQEINRFVFYPVKPALEQLHRIEIEVTAKVVTPKPEEPGEQPEQQKRKQQERPDDPYREELE